MRKRIGQTGKTHGWWKFGEIQDKCHQSLEEPKVPLQPLFELLLNDDSAAGFSFTKVDDVLKMPNSQQFMVQDISSYMWYSGFLIWGAFPQSHARSAFCSDWWINCCVWRWGNCGCLGKGIKTALGTEDWSPTIPTTAPSRQLPPAGWRSNLDPTSCTPCESGVSAAWQGARSGHHGGMWGKWWKASRAALEPAAKSQFWRCKCNDALVCGIL